MSLPAWSPSATLLAEEALRPCTAPDEKPGFTVYEATLVVLLSAAVGRLIGKLIGRLSPLPTERREA